MRFFNFHALLPNLPPRLSQHIHTVLWILLALGSLHSLITLYQGTLALGYPFATNRTESFILNGALRFAQGQNIYLGLNNPYYIVHVYNPLCYLPAGFLGRLFDLSTENILLSGRLMSYLSTLFLAAALSYWVRLKTGQWKYGLLVGVGIYFFQAFAATDFFRFRPEPPALLFTFVGVLVYLSEFRHRILFTSGLLFIAFLFKQPFIAAPIAVLIHLLVTKNYRSAVLFCAAMGTLLLGYFGIGYFATDGRFFQNTILAMAGNDINPLKNFTVYVPIFFQRSYALVLLPLLVVPAFIRLWPKYRFLVIYLLTCAGWTFLTAGKSGASDNYFSEFTILSLICTALVLAEYRFKQPVLVIGLLMLLSTQVIADWSKEGLFTPTIKVRYENSGAEIGPYIRRYCQPGGNTTTEHTLMLPEKIAVHCGNPNGLDWYLMDLLADRQQIDLSPLFAKVANGEFQRIVFDQQPRSRLEVRIFGLVKNGPYRRAYSDNVVSEWVLAK
jgi:hypothetical protein